MQWKGRRRRRTMNKGYGKGESKEMGGAEKKGRGKRREMGKADEGKGKRRDGSAARKEMRE